MTTQIRTWKEAEGAQPPRWNLSINGTPVPDGFVEQTPEGEYRTHYPRLESKTVSTLEEAKRLLELAPPITKGQMPIGKEAGSEEELITSDEAGELLGVSRFRVNAMVVNGILAGWRENGRILVSKASVEKKMHGVSASGPAGRFAHVFIDYRLEDSEEIRLYEIDGEDEGQMRKAMTFLTALQEKELPGKAEVLDYLSARRLMHSHETVQVFGHGDLPNLPQKRASENAPQSPQED